MMFGTHVPILNTLFDTYSAADEMNMPSFQIFLGNPKTYRRRQIDDTDIKKVIEKTTTTMFIHSPYIFSLCNQDVHEKCKESLIYELEVCGKLGCRRCGGVVVHPGSSKDTQQGLDRIVENINIMYSSHENLGTLLLENSCAQGTTLPHTLEHIDYIMKHIMPDANVGVCIDTCHSFASGMTDFEDPYAFRRKIEESFGNDKLKLIHLNDSMTPFNSKKDRHHTLGAGHIWTSKQKLRNFLGAFWDATMVTETGSYLEDLSYAM